MEQYLEVLSFSNALIVFIGEKIGVPTQDFMCPSEALSETSRFNSAIGDAIWHLIKIGEGNTMATEIQEMMPEGNIDVFARLAIQAAAEYFPKGYGHCEFFGYCAAVVGTAVVLYLKDNGVKDEMIFEMVAGVIGTVLSGHQVVSTFDCSDKTWQEMTEVAEKYNACHRALEQWLS